MTHDRRAMTPRSLLFPCGRHLRCIYIIIHTNNLRSFVHSFIHSFILFPFKSFRNSLMTTNIASSSSLLQINDATWPEACPPPPSSASQDQEGFLSVITGNTHCKFAYHNGSDYQPTCFWRCVRACTYACVHMGFGMMMINLCERYGLSLCLDPLITHAEIFLIVVI